MKTRPPSPLCAARSRTRPRSTGQPGHPAPVQDEKAGLGRRRQPPRAGAGPRRRRAQERGAGVAGQDRRNPAGQPAPSSPATQTTCAHPAETASARRLPGLANIMGPMLSSAVAGQPPQERVRRAQAGLPGREVMQARRAGLRRQDVLVPLVGARSPNGITISTSASASQSTPSARRSAAALATPARVRKRHGPRCFRPGDPRVSRRRLPCW